MRTALAVLLMLAASPAIAQDKEKLSAIDVSFRTILAFKVPDAVVQKLLPAGFVSNPPTSGPATGSNLGMTVIDYLMAQDPEGKLLPARTTVAINMPVKKTATGETGGVVIGGFIAPDAAPGAYFVFSPAQTTVDRRTQTGPEGKSSIDETWQVKADDGSALEIELQFVRGVPGRGKGEAKIFSAVKPEFYRIYRFDQATDVVRSAPNGIDRVSKFSFKASGPKLAPIFDGSQQVISITSVPFYSRSIYLPVM
ncbi:MAG: hypothetical protein C5B56_14905 [Proteobacteria bacterium]|nr:MAG: hypothetical protein C5B56_14905 [Pseudomonadota bacterium]